MKKYNIKRGEKMTECVCGEGGLALVGDAVLYREALDSVPSEKGRGCQA